MNDPMMEAGPAIDLDRRELLRRGAIVLGATALWTTPVVQTLGTRAASAGTNDDPTEAVLCPDEESAPSNLVFRYDAGPGTEASIEIHRPRGPAPGTWCVDTIFGGQAFEVLGKANPEMLFTIFADGAAESLALHTSCSQELTIGQRFGSLTLVEGRNKDGDRVGRAGERVSATRGECLSVQSTEEEDPEDLEEEEADSREAEAAEEEQAEKDAEAAEEEQAEKDAEAAEREQAVKDAEAAEREQAEKDAEAAEEEQAEKDAEAAEREQAVKDAEAAEEEQAEKDAEAAEREQAVKDAEAAEKEQAEKDAEAAEREQAVKDAEAAEEEQAEKDAEAAEKEQAEKDAARAEKEKEKDAEAPVEDNTETEDLVADEH